MTQSKGLGGQSSLTRSKLSRLGSARFIKASLKKKQDQSTAVTKNSNIRHLIAKKKIKELAEIVKEMGELIEQEKEDG